MDMQIKILLFFSLFLGAANFKNDPEYFFTNSVDYISLKFQEKNKYKLVISSCTFQVMCEGEFSPKGDTLIIKSKKIKENTDRNKDKWKKTSVCKKIEQKYLKNFNYLIIKDSTIIANELRWENLIFSKR